MDKAQVIATGERLVAEHLAGTDWTFGFNRRKRALGLCDYRKRMVSVSVHTYSVLTEDELEQTILHEIAHAKAGQRAGHGPEWKLVARSLGVRAPSSSKKLSCDPLQMGYKYFFVYEGQAIKGFYRKPKAHTISRTTAFACIKGKPESMGKIEFMSAARFAALQAA